MEELLDGPFADLWLDLDSYTILPKLLTKVPLTQDRNMWALKSSIHDEPPISDQVLTLKHY